MLLVEKLVWSGNAAFVQCWQKKRRNRHGSINALFQDGCPKASLVVTPYFALMIYFYHVIYLWKSEKVKWNQILTVYNNFLTMQIVCSNIGYFLDWTKTGSFLVCWHFLFFLSPIGNMPELSETLNWISITTRRQTFSHSAARGLPSGGCGMNTA